jgi:hypothetical protein
MSVVKMDRFGVGGGASCGAAAVCATGRRNSVINATEDASTQIAFLGRLMSYSTVPRR